jgi:hypothetical protein
LNLHKGIYRAAAQRGQPDRERLAARFGRFTASDGQYPIALSRTRLRRRPSNSA